MSSHELVHLEIFTRCHWILYLLGLSRIYENLLLFRPMVMGIPRYYSEVIWSVSERIFPHKISRNFVANNSFICSFHGHGHFVISNPGSDQALKSVHLESQPVWFLMVWKHAIAIQMLMVMADLKVSLADFLFHLMPHQQGQGHHSISLESLMFLLYFV